MGPFETGPAVVEWRYLGSAGEVVDDDIRRKGAVVVWPSPDTRGEVPPVIAAHFPGLVADVPHAFEREIQGRLPLLRIGWGVIRPQADAAGAAKPAR